MSKPWTAVVLAFALGIVVAAVPGVWSYHEARALRPGVRPAARTVLRAYWWSRITGSYWENEMVEQAHSLRGKPLADRLDFFTAIVLHTDLDTSRALLFVEAVGDDAVAFSGHLRAVRASAVFGTLSQESRRNLENWLLEMERIGKDKE